MMNIRCSSKPGNESDQLDDHVWISLPISNHAHQSTMCNDIERATGSLDWMDIDNSIVLAKPMVAWHSNIYVGCLEEQQDVELLATRRSVYRQRSYMSLHGLGIIPGASQSNLRAWRWIAARRMSTWWIGISAPWMSERRAVEGY